MTLTVKHIKNVCKSGKKAGRCDFIIPGKYGLRCSKDNSLQADITSDSINVLTGNCEGRTGIIGIF